MACGGRSRTDTIFDFEVLMSTESCHCFNKAEIIMFATQWLYPCKLLDIIARARQRSEDTDWVESDKDMQGSSIWPLRTYLHQNIERCGAFIQAVACESP